MVALIDNNGNQIQGPDVPAVGAGAFNPATTSAAHDFMRDRLWELNAVWGGTETLRAAGEKLMPRFERESLHDYNARLKGTRLLRNMFRQAVERTAGRLFEVPVKMIDGEEGKPAWELNDDADLRGNSFDRCARDMAIGAFRRGLSHVLVDYPVGKFRNLAEERAANPRPYLVSLLPEQILESYEDDLGACTYLRWYERNLAWDETANAVVMTERVQERTRGRYRVWQQVSEALKTNIAYAPGKVRASWFIKDEGALSQPRIMLHTLYAEREDYMVARTPLTEVADLTIEHWQLSSDVKNCLQQVLFPLLYATGINSKSTGQMSVGPKTILGSESDKAKFGYVEHTGAAIKSGEDHLVALEQRAEVYAGQLTRPSGDVKATQTAVSTAETSSWVKDFGISLQDKLQAILDDCCLWKPAYGAPRAVVNLDFAVDLPDGDLTELGSMRRAGDLPLEDYWMEMMRRNVLRSDFNPDEARKRIEDEQAESMKRETDMMRATASIEAPRQPADGGGE